MKKILFVISIAAILVACDGSKNQAGKESSSTTEENVDETSDEVITPAEEDSTNTMEADTVSSPDMEKPKENE